MSLDKEMRAAVEHWQALEPVLTPPESEAAYDALVERMDALMDYIGGDENHPLNGLLHLMGDLVFEYDAAHYEEVPAATGVEVLRHLRAAEKNNYPILLVFWSSFVVAERVT